jgi:p-cumate 2,3-dioxygenase subunit beta
MTAVLCSRQQVEELVFAESALIDAWRLDEWAACFSSDGRYIVPSLDTPPDEATDVDPNVSLCLIADDRALIDARVARLNNLRAHAENPRSRVRHFDSNVTVVALGEEILVESNLIISRWRRDRLDTYVGRCRHLLRGTAGPSTPLGAFEIVERRIILDLESLDPMGPLSFIA